MRRPSFCCEQHGGGDTRCQPQDGGESTLARVRRFLAVSMGGRSSSGRCPSTSSSSTTTTTSGTTNTSSSTKHHHALPPNPLHAPAHAVHSLLADMKSSGVGVQGVLGRPLEEVMAHHGEDSNGHGVPTLVHLLCCFILTHGVDYDTLVSDDWCAEEVRTRLLLERGQPGVEPATHDPHPGSESGVATGLLRLFLDELPHALIPAASSSRLLDLAQDCAAVGEERGGSGGEGDCDGQEEVVTVVVPRLRRLLHRRLPLHNLCLLRYLTAFIHQLRTSNHNTCPVPVSSLSRVLSRVLISGGSEVGQPQSHAAANRLGELLILFYSDIFQRGDEDDLDDTDDSSDNSISSPGSGVDSREEGVNGDDVDDEEDDDDDDEGDTTTTDTDDFRSPPVSPLRVARPQGGGNNSGMRVSAPLPLHQSTATQRLTEVGGGGGSGGTVCGGAWTSSSTIPGGGTTDKHKISDALPLDLASPVTFDPAAPVTRGPTTSSTQDVGGQEAKEAWHESLPLPPALHRKRKEHADGKEGGEHDPKFIRSTREVVGDLDSLGPKVQAYAKEVLVSPEDSLPSPDDHEPLSAYDDDDDQTQSAESSCISSVDCGDSEDSEVEDRQRDLADDSHEERRLSERSFPGSYQQVSRRTRRRTKKRQHNFIGFLDGEIRCQSSEEDRTSSSYLSSLTSEDEEPTRYNPVPTDVVPCDPSMITMRVSPLQEPSLGLSELLDTNEPVTSDRGSWGMRDSHSDNWHRTAPRYSRFDDTVIQSSWYRNNEDDVMVSPRASQAFIDTRAPPGPEDVSPPPGQGAVKILMKNINSIKKKIKRYEEEFEAAFGYRPSHSEKMKHKEIKKYMSELSKARKELKQMKDDVAGLMSVPTVFPLSLLRCQESTNPGVRNTGNSSGTADTLRQVEDRLREKRSAVGRPCDLKNMNSQEIQDEKTALQKALLYYESIHGRPTTREDRDLARPLYDRYRQVKRSVMRSGSRTKENMVELAPILEHVAMDFTLASPQHRGSLQCDENEKPLLESPSPPTTPPVFDCPPPVFGPPTPTVPTQIDDTKDGRRTVALGDLHALPLSELRERKKEAREEKKKLRRSLREFEENFEKDMARKVQKEDRGPMEQTYLDYKHAKAKLRLLEALLSKHEPQKV